MQKGSRATGLALLFIVVSACMHSAAQARQSSKSQAAEPAICSFIEKVVAARADNFAGIRSTTKDEFDTYDGKLTPDAQTDCTVTMPSESDGKTKSALYSCHMRRAKTMAEIKPEYERFKAELQACYPDIQFKNKLQGSDATHDETWGISGANSRLVVALYAMDNRFMVDAAPELVNKETKQNPAKLTLNIRALP